MRKGSDRRRTDDEIDTEVGMESMYVIIFALHTAPALGIISTSPRCPTAHTSAVPCVSMGPKLQILPRCVSALGAKSVDARARTGLGAYRCGFMRESSDITEFGNARDL